MNNIRPAEMEDAPKLIELLEQLGYPNTEAFILQKLEILISHPDESFFIYEIEDKVLAFMSLHIIPQIAVKGDFARISYFAVDSNSRSQGIGKAMEEYCVLLAKEKGCDRIELHSNTRREAAHKFYYRQGYEESPKYLMKRIEKEN